MLLGKHTLDETRDLLAVADYRFKETGKAYDALAVKPDDITHDWLALKEKWDKDRKSIANLLTVRAIDGFPRPSSLITTEPEWKRVLDYIQFQENVHGSLQDITARIEHASNARIMYENQPGQHSQDVDLELFKKLDSTTRDLDAAAESAKQGAKEAATSKFGLAVGGAILGGIVLHAVAKKYL